MPAGEQWGKLVICFWTVLALCAPKQCQVAGSSASTQHSPAVTMPHFSHTLALSTQYNLPERSCCVCIAAYARQPESLQRGPPSPSQLQHHQPLLDFTLSPRSAAGRNAGWPSSCVALLQRCKNFGALGPACINACPCGRDVSSLCHAHA